MTYYKLLDKLNRDEVVKTESKHTYYQYHFGEEKWDRTTIMTDYLWGESDKSDEYEEISEAEAIALLDEQRENITDCLNLQLILHQRLI